MLIKVELKDLKDKEEFAEFLKEKVKGEVSIEGDLILVDSSYTVKHVKTYLKRFLHKQGLRNKFRIRCLKGEITLIKEKEEK